MRIELEVPTSLNDITLRQYQKYMKILDQNGGEANDFVNKKLIEIFCNVSLEDVDKIPLREMNKVLEILSEAFQEKPDLIRHFKLLDVEMGFIPKLDDISLGEYIDMENTITDWQTMHKAMAVAYRPVNFKKGDKYTIAAYTPSADTQELMKEMPLGVVFSSMLFFYALGKELSKATLNYIQEEMQTEEMTSRLREYLVKNGVGINPSMDWQKGMFENLMKSQSKSSSPVLTS